MKRKPDSEEARNGRHDCDPSPEEESRKGNEKKAKVRPGKEERKETRQSDDQRRRPGKESKRKEAKEMKSQWQDLQ